MGLARVGVIDSGALAVQGRLEVVARRCPRPVRGRRGQDLATLSGQDAQEARQRGLGALDSGTSGRQKFCAVGPPHGRISGQPAEDLGLIGGAEHPRAQIGVLLTQARDAKPSR
jgi:hypothetical protein